MNMADLFVELFIELVVIGAGTLSWGILFALSAFGYRWISNDVATSAPTLLALFAILYVLGILMDGLANHLFGIWDKPIRRKAFPNNKEYHRARTYVYSYANDPIIELFKYGRSRMRITRAWCINWALLAVSVPLLVWTRLSQLDLGMRWLISILGCVICGTCSVGSWLVWRRLTVNDCRRLAETFAFLSREQKQK